MRKLLILAVTVPCSPCSPPAAAAAAAPPPPPPPPPVQVIANPGPPNVEPITVDAGPAGLTGRVVNIAYVTVRICRASTTQCQDVDHVQVDTGSSGLRILASALGSVVLDVEAAPGGLPIAECMQFADGSSFGPVATRRRASCPPPARWSRNMADPGDRRLHLPPGARGLPRTARERRVAASGPTAFWASGPSSRTAVRPAPMLSISRAAGTTPAHPRRRPGAAPRQPSAPTSRSPTP